MGVVYHGSSERGLTKIEPKKSTHGTYVYATFNRMLAIQFSQRCGDDLTYEIGRIDKSKPYDLVELIPGAFDKMYSNDASIYTLSSDTFKDINTGFDEVVSNVAVDVISEDYISNVWDELLKFEQEGLLKIYRYPNKPDYISEDYLIDKWRMYKDQMNVIYDKNRFDRFVYLHPELLDKTNRLIKEFGLDFSYTINDLLFLFSSRIERQLYDDTHEQYIECAYMNMCNTYPGLKPDLDSLYEGYKKALNNKTRK